MTIIVYIGTVSRFKNRYQIPLKELVFSFWMV